MGHESKRTQDKHKVTFSTQDQVCNEPLPMLESHYGKHHTTQLRPKTKDREGNEEWVDRLEAFLVDDVDHEGTVDGVEGKKDWCGYARVGMLETHDCEWLETLEVETVYLYSDRLGSWMFQRRLRNISCKIAKVATALT